MQACKLLSAIIFCVVATVAHAAGFRAIDISADGSNPAIKGAVWYPCSQPPGEVDLGVFTLPAVKDCPLPGERLPLIVISHGRTGSFIIHHDIAEVLADAGFIVAALNHPGDTARDVSRTNELAIFVERPDHVRRLIDFMLGASALAPTVDRDRVGFFGFSRGGYTGLALIGARPDWANATEFCQELPRGICGQVRKKEFPARLPTPDPRIKAAVIVDPLSVFFSADSFSAITVPVQLWASERGGDGVLPHSVDIVDRGLRPQHEYRVVPNAGHFSFVAPCSSALAAAAPEICTDSAGFDRAAFHRQFNADMLAFFRTHLKAPQ
jgi:predicted dienelactone hydrolase